MIRIVVQPCIFPQRRCPEPSVSADEDVISEIRTEVSEDATGVDLSTSDSIPIQVRIETDWNKVYFNLIVCVCIYLSICFMN